MKRPFSVQQAKKALKQRPLRLLCTLWQLLDAVLIRRYPHDSDPGRIRLAADLGSTLESHLIGLAWLKGLKQDVLTIDAYGNTAMLTFLASDHDFLNKIHNRADLKKRSKYDVCLILGQLIEVPYINMPKIFRLSPDLANMFSRIMLFAQTHNKYIQFAPQFGGAWAKMSAKVMGWDRWSVLGANKAFPFSRYSRLPLNPLTTSGTAHRTERPQNSYITIHSSALINGQSQTRQWPTEYWADFCKLFKAKYPHLAIVQVGFSNEPAIVGADRHIVNVDSWSELAAVLKNAALHIDEDSDLVHLRYVLGGRSLVLFGPTVSSYIAYPENINIVSKFCKECMCMLNNWTTHCVLNYSQPECMRNITPDSVFQAADQGLSEAMTQPFLLLKKIID